jgi:hypothetical protein
MRLFSAAPMILLLAMAATRASTHDPLAPEYKEAMAKNLTKLAPSTITIACGSAACRSLADDFADAFAAAQWKVSRIDHGGIGITDVTGVRVDSCEQKEAIVKKLIEGATPLSVEMVDEGPCNGDAETYLVVGD